MPVNIEPLRGKIEARLKNNARDNITVSDFIEALQGANARDRQELVALVKDGNRAGLGRKLLVMLGAMMDSKARAKFEELKAKPNLDGKDLEQIL